MLFVVVATVVVFKYCRSLESKMVGQTTILRPTGHPDETDSDDAKSSKEMTDNEHTSEQQGRPDTRPKREKKKKKKKKES